MDVRYSESRRIQFDWSDERIKQLTRMWIEEEMSAGQIASDFGISRSAILGKIDRLGINGRECDLQNRSKSAERREARKRIAAGRVRNPTRVLAKRNQHDPGLAAVPFDPTVEIPAAEPCALLELDDTKCHWPFGEVGKPDFHFCGGQADYRSYCAGHAQIAYRSRG